MLFCDWRCGSVACRRLYVPCQALKAPTKEAAVIFFFLWYPVFPWRLTLSCTFHFQGFKYNLRLQVNRENLMQGKPCVLLPLALSFKAILTLCVPALGVKTILPLTMPNLNLCSLNICSGSASIIEGSISDPFHLPRAACRSAAQPVGLLTSFSTSGAVLALGL